MYKVPRFAEMQMQVVLIVALSIMFNGLKVSNWLYCVLVLGGINLIVHAICLYGEKKEAVRDLTSEERKYIKKETLYTLKIAKKKTLQYLYSMEVLTCIIAIVPATYYILIKKDMEQSSEFYSHATYLLMLFIFLMSLHVVLNYIYSRKLIKSYKESMVYQLKTRRRYYSLVNNLIENIVNPEVDHYEEKIDAYNKKMKEYCEILKIHESEKDNKLLIKKTNEWLE